MSIKGVIPIAGFPVVNTTASVLAMYLHLVVGSNKKMALFFANTNFIVQCQHLQDQMQNDAVTIVNDGVGMDIAAYLMHRETFQENLNGTDFTPYLFSGASKPLRVFMLGGKPEVLNRAAEYVRNTLGQTVVGTCDGYAGIGKQRPNLVEAINRTQAEIVLVALGNPTQEEWILANKEALNVNVLIGVGALFDFWAGDKPRAPRLAQRVRLEWLYRLCLEPRRLLRRYTIDIVRFLMLCRRHRDDNRQT